MNALLLQRARCYSLVLEKALWKAEDICLLIGRGYDTIAWIAAIGPKL